MTAKTTPIVYITASTEEELKTLHEILEPHSWASGEFGLMLTDVAYVQCVKSLSSRTEKSVKAFLRATLRRVRNFGVGDVCLNFGLLP